MRIIRWVERTFVPPAASDTLRAKTVAFVLGVCIIAGFLTLWLIPMVGFGVHPLAWAAEGVTVALMGVGLLFGAYTKKLAPTVHLVNTLGYLGGLSVQTALGGLQASGYVGIWFMLVPVLTSALLSRRAALIWLGVFIALTLGVMVVEAEVARLAPPVPVAFRLFNSILNIAAVSTILVSVNLYLLAQLEATRERADNLLLNILPRPIAERLKRDPGPIADGYAEVTVLFADLVGFTQLAANADPAALVQLLNAIFSDFDELAHRHGLEKIKTIGDAYMVVGGLPIPRADHAEAVAAMARDMLSAVQRHRGWQGEPIQMRIGIHTGPVVAGVIGRQKFSYDLWGDTVNTASRMEAHGMGGAIQVTEATYQKLRGHYHFEQRPPLPIKGKGAMVTYLLGAPLTDSESPPNADIPPLTHRA